MPVQTRKGRRESSDHKTAIKTGKSATHATVGALREQPSRRGRSAGNVRRSRGPSFLRGHHQLSDSRSSLPFHDGTATSEDTNHGPPVAPLPDHETAQDPLSDREENDPLLSSARSPRKVSEIIASADEDSSTQAHVADKKDEVGLPDVNNGHYWATVLMSENIDSGSVTADSHLPSSSTTAAGTAQHDINPGVNNSSNSQNATQWLLNTPLPPATLAQASRPPEPTLLETNTPGGPRPGHPAGNTDNQTTHTTQWWNSFSSDTHTGGTYVSVPLSRQDTSGKDNRQV